MKAYDVGADVKIKKFTIGGEYKRVDPLYRSLGSYYLQEDYANLLMKFKFRIGNILNFNGRGGVQRNNLSNFRKTTNTRNIYSLNVTVSPSRKFQTSLRYSNFQNERSDGITEINDSLRFTRTTESFGISPRISFGISSISLSANLQNMTDLINDVDSGLSIFNFNGNLTYTLNFREKGLMLGLGGLTNRNIIKEQIRERIGMRFNVSKSLIERKLRIRGTTSYTVNLLEGISDGKSITARGTFNYKVNDLIRSDFSISYLNRSGGVQSFSEIRGSAKVSVLFKKRSIRNNKNR